ncbi:MAG: hypothetical protein E6J26_03800, partial [Chloroflexi bacterium]
MAAGRRHRRAALIRQDAALRFACPGRTKGHAMKIQRLHLDGFGRWTDAGFEFAPGLNVIYGANQAGKSTMQQALLPILYGFNTGQRQNAQNLLEHYRPWHQAAYGGWLEYQLDNGHA